MSQTSPSEFSVNSSASAYYSTFWKSERWGGREPNYDERARLDAINKLIDQYVYRGQPLAKILDVGCGRGWLTHQVRKYGSAQGLEAVPETVEIARQTFSDLKFDVADLTRLDRAELERFGHADLIVCSEVVEHVSDGEKPQFFRGLFDLTRLGGHLLITTPRGEFWNQWLARGPELQPVEQWVTETELTALAEAVGFRLLAKTRAYIPNYEVHRASAWLLRGRIGRRLVRCIKPLWDAVIYANSLYQVALFQRVGSTESV